MGSLGSNLKVGLTTLGLAAGMTFAFAGEAQAALVSCPATWTVDGTARVHDGGGAPVLTAASECQYIIPPNNSTVANVANVNANQFFGFSDWESGGVLQLGAASTTGTWTIPPAFLNFAVYDYMITFKDGGGTNLTSFFLNELFSSGGWNTPFTDPPFDLPGMSTTHEVSHFSIFRRVAGDDITIAEPASLLLMGMGLAAAARRMRRRVAVK